MRPNGLIRRVVTVNGSGVWILFVTLKTRALPPGAVILAMLNISGLAGTMTTVDRITIPLLLITSGYVVPAAAEGIPGGTTKSIRCRLTYVRPHAAPLIVMVTPLNSIGNSNLRLIDPVADLIVIALSNAD